jgi:hypothetical protein
MISFLFSPSSIENSHQAPFDTTTILPRMLNLQ